MATRVRMQQELEELQNSEQTDAVRRRIDTIKARIALRDSEINEIIDLVGCRSPLKARRVLERKRSDWIHRRVSLAREDAIRFKKRAPRAKAARAGLRRP